MAECFAMAIKLVIDRKFGAIKEKTISTARKAIKVLSFNTNIPMEKPVPGFLLAKAVIKRFFNLPVLR